MNARSKNGADQPRLSTDPRRLESDLDRFGYCLVEGLLAGDELRTVRAKLDTVEAERREDARAEPVDWERRDGDQWVLLLPSEDGLDRLLLDPLVLGLARHVIGERIHLSGFSSHIVHPGNQAMGLHTDQWWLPQPRLPGAEAVKAGNVTRATQPYGSPQPATHPIAPATAINVMWAITDFTAANGATRLVPGSHQSGRYPDPSATYETVDAEVPAGCAVAWDVRTWHASGSNGANAPRIGITTIYSAPQFRQLQNFPLALKPAAQAGLSDAMRELLGFKLWSSYGATDDFSATFARPGYER